MYTTDDEEQVITEDTIDTAKQSPSDAEPIKTAKPLPISAVPVFATRAPIDIVTRAVIEK